MSSTWQRAKQMVTLDFRMIRYDLNKRQLLIVLLFSGVGYFYFGLPGMIVGIWGLVGRLSLLIFEASDKSIETLYTVLCVPRKQVVLGRYAFLMLCCASAALIFLLLAVPISLLDGSGVAQAVVFAYGLFVAMAANNLLAMLLIFKMGYQKARMIVVSIPMGLLAVSIGWSYVQLFVQENPSIFGGSYDLSVIEDWMFVVSLAGLVLFGWYVYHASVKYYQLRDL